MANFMIRIPDKLDDKLNILKEKTGITKASIVRKALEFLLLKYSLDGDTVLENDTTDKQCDEKCEETIEISKNNFLNDLDLN